MKRNSRGAAVLVRIGATTLCAAAVLALASCASPAQTMRDLAPKYGLSFDIASDEILDEYGEVACEGGRDALGDLLFSESDRQIDELYELATSAYCPE